MLSLAALADPTRRRIIELLAEKDRSAGEIVAEFHMSAPAISQHLKVLRTAKLVTVRIQGQHRIQSLDFRGIKQIEDWISKTTGFWENRLHVLETETRSEEPAPKLEITETKPPQPAPSQPKPAPEKRVSSIQGELEI